MKPGVSLFGFRQCLVLYCLALALPASASAGRTRALLVGWTKRDESLGPEYVPTHLPGKANAEMIESVLKNSWAFDPTGIKLLTGLDATKSAVVSAFEEYLIKDSRADDTVVFFYSGHGMTYPDISKTSGRSNAFMMADTVRLPGNDVVVDTRSTLTGPEIARLLARLKTKNVTVVLDACHATGGTRGSLLTMGTDDGCSPCPTPRDWPTFDYETQASAAYVVLAACDTHELANAEGPTFSEKGLLPGFSYFSRALAQALGRDHPTYASLIREVQYRVSRHVQDQSPMAYGTTSLSVFGDKHVSTPSGFALSYDSESRQHVVLAGMAQGVHTGQILEISVGGKKVATATVIEAGPTRSAIQFDTSAPSDDDLALAAAVPVDGFDLTKLRLALRGEAAERLGRSIEWKGMPVQPVAVNAPWDFAIEQREDQTIVVNAQGQRVMSVEPLPSSLKHAVGELAKGVMFKRITADPKLSGIHIEVESVPCTYEVTKRDADGRALGVRTTVQREAAELFGHGSPREFHVGSESDTYALRIRAKITDRKLWSRDRVQIAVLELTPRGVPLLAWPKQKSDQFGPAWESTLSALPCDGEWHYITMAHVGASAFVKDVANQAVYENVWPLATLQNGSESTVGIYKVIATTQYVEYSNFESTRGDNATSFQNFVAAVNGGGSFERGGVDGKWATVDVTVRLTGKKAELANRNGSKLGYSTSTYPSLCQLSLQRER